MDGSQMKFANLEDFMPETHAELKIGLCHLYFADEEWVVVKAKSVDSKYIVQDRFLDAVPSALESALRFFYTLAA